MNTKNPYKSSIQGILLTFALLFFTTSLFATIEIADVTYTTGGGACDGSIEVIATGTAGPFSLVLYQDEGGNLMLIDDTDDTQGTYVFSGLCEGDYLIEVHNAFGCVNDLSTRIYDCTSFPIQLSGEVSNQCISMEGGSIDLALSGSNGNAFSFEWSNGEVTEDVSGLQPGEYCVTVTGEGDCTAEECFEVGDDADPDFAIQLESMTCVCPGGWGAIDITVTGSSGPYTFIWEGENGYTSTAEDPDDIPEEGGFRVNVFNAYGCSVFKDIYIEYCNFDFENFETNIQHICDAVGTGSIEVQVNPENAAAAPLYFQWYDLDENLIGESTSPDGYGSIEGLEAGKYCLFVFSENGCMDYSCELSIEAYDPPLVDWVTYPAHDAASGDGAIDLMVNDNIDWPYTFLWSTGATSENLDGLNPGSYSVTVSDAISNCTYTYTIQVDDCAGLIATLELSAVVTPMTEQLNDGAIDLTLEGAEGYAFNFYWEGDGNFYDTEDISNLNKGKYCVAVKNGDCDIELTECFFVCSFGLDFKIEDYETCSGTTVTALVTEAKPPVSYSWSSDPGNTTAADFLTYGEEHCITVTDGYGCQATKCITVNLPELVLDFEVTNATLGSLNGSVTAIPQGGKKPYTYLWNTGDTGQEITNLNPGEYCVTATDVCGNSLTACAIVECEIGQSQVEEKIEDVSCGNAEGGIIDIDVLVNGANQYTWSNGANTGTISGLAAGEYCVTIVNAPTGCEFMDCYTVGTSGNGNFSLSFEYDYPCVGGENGSITANPIGGTGPFSYYWYSGWVQPPITDTTQTIENIPAGWYNVVVTDALGCARSGFAFMWPAPSFDIEVELDPKKVCPGGTTLAAAIPLGGTAPHTYQWQRWAGAVLEDLGTTGQIISGLEAGVYFIVVTDAEGCERTEHFYVPEYPEIMLESEIKHICSGDNALGEIKVGYSGGTPPLSFNWSNGATSYHLENLEAGDYTITATDAEGCTVVSTYTVLSETSPLIATLDLVSPICPGTNTGAIDLFVGGGGHTYAWSNGATTQDLSGLPAGEYTVTVSSDYCTTVITYEIKEENFQVEVAIDGSEMHPLNGSDMETGSIDLEVSGDNPPYSFEWGNGATTEDVDELASGYYKVTITSASGCSTIESYYVSLCENPKVYISIDEVTSCIFSSGGSISTNVNLGTPPFYYEWAGPNGFTSTAPSISSLYEPGIYCVTVTDQCNRTDIICQELSCECDLNVAVGVKDPCGTEWFVDSRIYVYYVGGPDDHYYELEWSPGGETALLYRPPGSSPWEFEVISGTVSLNDVYTGTYCATLTGEFGCITTDCVYYDPNTTSVTSFRSNEFDEYIDGVEGEFYKQTVYGECKIGKYCGEHLVDGFDFGALIYEPGDLLQPCQGGGKISCSIDENFSIEVPVNDFSSQILTDNSCGCYFPLGSIPDMNDIYYPLYVEYPCNPQDDPGEFVLCEECPPDCNNCYVEPNDDCTVSQICAENQEVLCTVPSLFVECYLDLCNGFYNLISRCATYPYTIEYIIESGVECPDCADNESLVCQPNPCNPFQGEGADRSEQFNNSKHVGGKLKQQSFDTKFNIYPNPFNDNLTIEAVFSKADKIVIKVIDLLGNEILTEERIVLKGLNKIPLKINNSMPDGLYQISISNQIGERFVQKIVHFKE